MTLPNKINYLRRKYDLFIQEYAKAAPKLDEPSFLECFLGKQIGSGGEGPGGGMGQLF